MSQRTITLPADLVERFEVLAEQRGRSLDELIAELLSTYIPASGGNWALAVAKGMEAAHINWIDDPDASVSSREIYKRHLDEKWKRTQNSGGSDA
ncbi:MAG TPA: CopG family transcriptional regulator [Aggregatilineales bacterium]|nr:CopG family transcriptional regulator [Aggregatilineales bacterium]